MATTFRFLSLYLKFIKVHDHYIVKHFLYPCPFGAFLHLSDDLVIPVLSLRERQNFLGCLNSCMDMLGQMVRDIQMKQISASQDCTKLGDQSYERVPAGSS